MSTYAEAPSRPQTATVGTRKIQIRHGLATDYDDIYTPEVLNALEAMAGFNGEQQELMAKRSARRLGRFRNQEKIGFLDAESYIPRTQIKVADAREGGFVGSEIPPDLQRQWIQGTGRAAKPNA